MHKVKMAHKKQKTIENKRKKKTKHLRGEAVIAGLSGLAMMAVGLAMAAGGVPNVCWVFLGICFMLIGVSLVLHESRVLSDRSDYLDLQNNKDLRSKQIHDDNAGFRQSHNKVNSIVIRKNKTRCNENKLPDCIGEPSFNCQKILTEKQKDYTLSCIADRDFYKKTNGDLGKEIKGKLPSQFNPTEVNEPANKGTVLQKFLIKIKQKSR